MKIKWFNKIHFRIFFLLLLITFLFLLFLFNKKERDFLKIQNFLTNFKQERILWFNKVINLKSSNLESFAFDYTYWDEMVKFVQTKDINWVKTEIIPSFVKFNINYTWIYDKNYNLAFEYSTNDKTIPFTLINNLDFRKKINISYFNHFFIENNDKLIEVYGAPIQPSRDSSRITKPQGYFFVGRLWDRNYLNELETITNSKIEILDRNEVSKTDFRNYSDSLKVLKPLYNYDNKCIKYVLFSFSPVFLKPYFESSKSETTYYLLFISIILISLSFYLYFSIIKPIKLLSLSLENNNTEYINKLLKSKNEFKNLAELITDYNIQRNILIDEIKKKNILEKDLRENEKKYRSLFENMTSGLALCKIILDENNKPHDYIILEINNALEKMLDIKPDKILNINAKNIAKEYNSQWPIFAINIFGDTALKGVSTSFETYNKRTNKFFYITVFSPQKYYFALLFDDITERKKSERELIKTNKKLEHTINELNKTQKELFQNERLKALGQLASGIAHDINNSLAPILGYSDLLSREIEDEKISKRLSIIKTASLDIKKTIEHLREFYRPKLDEDTFDIVNLNQVINSAIELTISRWKTIPESQGKKIDIITNLQSDLLLIKGNESQLRECYTNLIINACDAMNNSGTLTFKTYTKNGKIFSEIIDTGLGMDDETLAHCFEPFYTTKGKKGTGLGLSMVYGIIKRHEGEILVESEIGKGTKFTLIFPINYKTTFEQQENLFKNIQTLKILLIDDDESVINTLSALLTEQNHEVISSLNAKNGKILFENAFNSGNKFDLVITDLGMPEITGIELSKLLREIDYSIPIILLTGWGSFISKNDIETVNIILSKPVTIEDLNNALYKIFGS
jgi:signal transduction histidine kinase/CheY-like chemotaxis protein/sensor domain CHASE-containing protein